MQVDLSVVLVNWNACDVTSAALASIEQHTRGITYELLVIDNGSTLDRSAIELPLRFPRIVFVGNDRNLGFSAANNQAFARARGRYVLALNTDTIQTENALGAAVGYMDAHPEVGALGILHRNADAALSEQPSTFAFPAPWRELAALVGVARWVEPIGIPATAEQDVDWACGSFLMIRRECLDQVGPFDERFFSYDEDVDWCRRARDAGWAVRFWRGVSMVHIGGVARPFMKDKMFVHFRSHLSYIRKHHSWFLALLYYMVMVGRLSLSTLWQAVRWLAGATSFAEVQDRWQRQRQFVLLKAGRTGG